MALAKARICPGLAIATGRPAPARVAATTVSKPPVASSTMRLGFRTLRRATRSSSPAPVRGKIFTTWTHGNIEAVLRYIDTNGDLLHGDPSLSKRARGAAPATVRVRWNGGRGAKLSNGLRGPKVRRTPARHRASLARRVG